MRKVLPCGLILLGCLICGLGLASPGLTQPFLLDGTHWTEISYDARVTYVKGVGNMADFECQSRGSQANPELLHFHDAGARIKGKNYRYRGQRDRPVLQGESR